MKDHPTSALNRLVDDLSRAGDLSDLESDAVVKRQLVELDREWEVSAATDIGGLLEGLVRIMVSNPAAMNSDEVPPEALTLMTTGSASGTVVLESDEEDSQGRKLMVVLSADELTGKSTVDDLEGERTVFGLIHEIIPHGKRYSLEKVFLAGLSRSIRRTIKTNDLLKLAEALQRPLTEEDLFIPGPLVVSRPLPFIEPPTRRILHGLGPDRCIFRAVLAGRAG